MPTVRVRGVDLYYEEYGSGPNLLVAHGLMGSVALAARFGERPRAIADRGIHVVAYDARGHGRSGYTKDRAAYSWSALAEDMFGLIEALALGPTSIYGGSMGAGTALTLALQHPEVVDKLILMSPPPFGDEIVPARRLFVGMSYLYQFLGSSLTSRVLALSPDARRAQRENPDLDLRSWAAAQRRAAVVPAIRGLLLGPDLPAERFAEIEQPALVLTHPDDPIHPLSSGDLLHDQMKHARLAVAPTLRYWEENPDALTHVAASFIKGEAIAQGLPAKVLHEHAKGSS